MAIFSPPFSKSPINAFLFTLSGFPLHIYLKHLLSISFLYFSGITHELTIKVKIGQIKALMISTLQTDTTKIFKCIWENMAYF
jgi:hypothetical protein